MQVKLKKVRLSYHNLFTARDYEGDKNFKYSAVFIIEPGSENAAAITSAIQTETTEKFKGKAEAILNSIKHNNMKMAYRDGSLSDKEEYQGKMYLSSSNKIKPTVVDRALNILQEEDGMVYSGCYVNVVVDVYAHEKHKAVFCTLGGVQFHSDGEAFTGGRKAAVSDFEDLGVDDQQLAGLL